MQLHFAPALRIAAVVAGTLLGSQSAFADIVASLEAAGTQQTTVSNIITETFDGLSAGTQITTLSSSIGHYSAGVGSTIIVGADQYGGADKTNYISVGAQAGQSGGSMTLTLNGPADYFGMWWSAIDAKNTLQFYKSGVLVKTFTSANLPAFSSAYDGNPNYSPKPNTGEHYAYINFNGTVGTTFDTIVFSNDGSTGFETDNHSIHGVPEPSALLMGGAASLVGLVVARRRRKA
jgi:hypothetical protein